MKLIKRFVFVLFFCFSINYAQSQGYTEINTGFSVPKGDLDIDQRFGFQFGLNGRISPNNPFISLNWGLRYILIRGVHRTFGYTQYNTESIRILQLSVGPQIGKESGLYFHPSIAGNYYREKINLGFDLCLGELYPLKNSKNKIDLGVKFSFLNPFSESDAGELDNVVLLFLGLAF